MKGKWGGRTTENKFERCCLRRPMNVVAVGVRERGKVDIPVVLVFVDVVPEHGEKCSIVPLDLAVRLRVVCRHEDVVQVHKLTDVLEQL